MILICCNSLLCLRNRGSVFPLLSKSEEKKKKDANKTPKGGRKGKLQVQ